MQRIVWSMLLAACLLMTPASIRAQSSGGSGFSDEETKALAAAVAELSGRRAEVAALKDVVRAKDEHIAALDRLVADQEKLVAQWKTAAEARTEANGIDARIEASYRESVARYEKELERVRDERDGARRSRWAWALGGVVIGVLAVLAAENSGGN